MKALFLIMILADSVSAKTISEAHLGKLVNEALGAHFENDLSINGASIFLRGSLSKPDYFFQTNINYSYFLGAKPSYFIEYNPSVLKDAPSDLALRAILTHELFHVKDMIERTRVGNLHFGINYTLKNGARYERFTDERTLDQGEALGLIEYREWIYTRLTPKQIAVKKKRYYTPEEIVARSMIR